MALAVALISPDLRCLTAPVTFRVGRIQVDLGRQHPGVRVGNGVENHGRFEPQRSGHGASREGAAGKWQGIALLSGSASNYTGMFSLSLWSRPNRTFLCHSIVTGTSSVSDACTRAPGTQVRRMVDCSGHQSTRRGWTAARHPLANRGWRTWGPGIRLGPSWARYSDLPTDPCGRYNAPPRTLVEHTLARFLTSSGLHTMISLLGYAPVAVQEAQPFARAAG